MQVKICGITRPEDGVAAVQAGADAIGLVFFDGSKRAVTVEAAQAICRAVPPLTSIVGLFVDASNDEINAVLKGVPLSVLQFHGAESSDQCARFDRPWMKALPVVEGMSIGQRISEYADGVAVLLDSATTGQFGGSGHAFDWALLPKEPAAPIVLAGGLSPDNVAEAIRVVRPAAVDVSSGVESAPGIKDVEKMRQFVENAKAAAKEIEQ